MRTLCLFCGVLLVLCVAPLVPLAVVCGLLRPRLRAPRYGNIGGESESE